MTTQETLETRYPMVRDIDVHAVIADARRQRSQVAGRYLRDGGRFLIEIVGGLFSGFVMLLRQRAAVRELQQLDDHMLADIGLSRSQISAAASGHLPQPHLFQDAGRIVSGFARRMVEWDRWNHANDHLRRLDNRSLDDIGLTRGELRLAEGADRPESEKDGDRHAA